MQWNVNSTILHDLVGSLCGDGGWDRVIVFMVASMVLGFGFVMKVVLTTRRCSSCWWTVVTQLKPFFPHTALSTRRPEAHKMLGGDAICTADSNWQKGYSIPCGIVFHKLGESLPWVLLRGDWVGISQLVVGNCVLHHSPTPSHLFIFLKWV